MVTQIPDQKAIVIGSGIGGMTAAITLAKFGYRVTLAEKNPLAGGLMRGYTRRGFDCEVGIHYLGALGPGQPLHRIFEFLGILPGISLEPLGAGGVTDRYYLDDFVFDLPAGLEAFAEHLRAAFPSEQKQITEVLEIVNLSAARLSSLDVLSGRSMTFDLKKDFHPVNGFLKEINCSSRLRQVLSVITASVGVPPDKCPLYLWSTALASYLLSSWRISGSGARMAEICAERFRELGGTIITGEEAVKLKLADKSVKGVTFKSGRELQAPLVVAAVHPKIALALIPEGSCLPEYRRRIQALEETPGVVCLQAGIPESDHGPVPYNIYNLRVENEDLSDASFIQLKRTGKPDWNILTVIRRSDFQQWKQWENTFSGHRDGEYEAAKNNEARQLLEESRKILGPCENARVLDVFTPLTLRDLASSPEGSAYGIMRSVKQKFRTAALHRTPIKGFHVVGQSVMAPGILGTSLGAIRTLMPVIGPEILDQWRALFGPKE
ncbi:MAG: NAD(P)/FAD-dependent oxidoreductase [Proteobacteria bacterium]|nr:NAD(P)/FAD-dependent oxidoreductase [Pseudomonadota bacterium]